jgi:hypothetical protein
MPPSTESQKRNNAARIVPAKFDARVDELGALFELLLCLDRLFIDLQNAIVADDDLDPKTYKRNRHFGEIWRMQKSGSGLILAKISGEWPKYDKVFQQRMRRRREAEAKRARNAMIGRVFS